VFPIWLCAGDIYIHTDFAARHAVSSSDPPGLVVPPIRDLGRWAGVAQPLPATYAEIRYIGLEFITLPSWCCGCESDCGFMKSISNQTKKNAEDAA